jgi:AraC family transcriptional activator of pyochelin receptor
MSSPKPTVSFAAMVEEGLSLDPRAALPTRVLPHEPIEQHVEHPMFGAIHSQSHVLPGMHLTFIRAQMRDHDVFLPETNSTSDVATVFMLQGHIYSSFSQLDQPMDMCAGRHNLVHTSAPGGYHLLRAHMSLDAVHISFEPSTFRRLLDTEEPVASRLLRRLDREEAFAAAAPQATAISPAMYAALSGLRACPLRGHARRLYLEGRVIELLALQLDFFQQTAVARPGLPTPTDRENFQALRDYLDAHFLEPQTLDGLARRFALNEFKLKKGFKALFDDTVFGYLQRRRLEHARQLLLDGEVNVNEAADLVGYANPNHFSTAFRKFFGIAPGSLKP